MKLKDMIPTSWRVPLAAEMEEPYFAELGDFLDEEYATQTIYPKKQHIFAALEATPFESTKAFLLGQDPYHGPGQAHGLCFSVLPGVDVPASLRNVYKEIHTDLGHAIPNHGYLMSWAKQGMLMLNAVLTVRQASPASHKGAGWEKFTDAIIQAVSHKDEPVVFALWGGFARKKKKLIDTDKHRIIECAHPSPLSFRYWQGARPFSKVNTALEELDKAPIDWRVPDLKA